MTKYNSIFGFIMLVLLLSSCGGNELMIPKPPTYLRSEFPAHTYSPIPKGNPYSFELADAYICKPVLFKGTLTNHQEILLGKLNGVLYINYYPLPNRDSLIRYINLSNDKVDEHQVKAEKINDFTISHPKNKVYGTFFELTGNVATNFQFYLTDSSSHFMRGELLMNCAPNYDSLRPSLDYIKQDLYHLFETMEWK